MLNICHPRCHLPNPNHHCSYLGVSEGLPPAPSASTLDTLLSIFCTGARAIRKKKKSDHIALLLQTLPWLPTAVKIKRRPKSGSFPRPLSARAKGPFWRFLESTRLTSRQGLRTCSLCLKCYPWSCPQVAPSWRPSLTTLSAHSPVLSALLFPS